MLPWSIIQKNNYGFKCSFRAFKFPEILNFNCFFIYSTFFNLNEFKTTLILLKAIATPANIGFNKIPNIGYKTPAATGMKAAL